MGLPWSQPSDDKEGMRVEHTALEISMKTDWFLQKPAKLVWTGFVGLPKNEWFHLNFF
jgi:hypothetical protein